MRSFKRFWASTIAAVAAIVTFRGIRVSGDVNPRVDGAAPIMGLTLTTKKYSRS